MRFSPLSAVVISAISLSTMSQAQQIPPAPEPRPDVPADKCLIELTLPDHAKVKIDDRDYNEQRRILLPSPSQPYKFEIMGHPYCKVVVDFPNGGRLGRWIEIKDGAATRVALSEPPLETMLLRGPLEDITSLAFSPDGKWIAMGTYAFQVILWETATGRIRWDGDTPGSNAAESFVSVAFSPDGRCLAVGSEFAGVAILDTATGKRLRDLAGDSSDYPDFYGANAVAFSPDGRQVFAALNFVHQPTIAIWDAKSGKLTKALRGPKPPSDDTFPQFGSLAVSPDGRQVVAGTEENLAFLFDLPSGKILRTFQSNSGDIRSVAISHDGRTLLMGTSNSEAILWDLKSGKQLRTFHCATDGFSHWVDSVAFSPDDRKALMAGDKQTFLFDLGSGAKERILNTSDNFSHAVAFSPDGQRILTSGDRNWISSRLDTLREAVLWDVASGKRVQTFPSPKDSVRSLTFDAEGQRLTVMYENNQAAIWDMNTGKLTKRFQPTPQKPEKTSQTDSEVTVPSDDENAPDEYQSPDGRWIVKTAEHNTVVLRDTHTSKETVILDYALGPIIRGVAFSPKTSRIAVADKDSVYIFNPKTGRKLATLISTYGGRDWLTTTPGSYCEGSSGGLSLVQIKIGEAVYPFEHLDKKLNRPDIVAKILSEIPNR